MGTTTKTNIITDAKIIHPQGNMLRLDFPLTRREVITVNGESKVSESDFFPKGRVIVRLTHNFHSYDFEADVNGNIIAFEDNGKLAVGEYDITVICKDSDGKPFRRTSRQTLVIVDNAEYGGIYESSVYNTEAAYLHIIDRASAIVFTDDDIIIDVGGHIAPDDDDDDEVTINAEFGDGNIEETYDEIIINT